MGATFLQNRLGAYRGAGGVAIRRRRGSAHRGRLDEPGPGIWGWARDAATVRPGAGRQSAVRSFESSTAAARRRGSQSVSPPAGIRWIGAWIDRVEASRP